MSSLYPEILFHFTKRDRLFKILEHTFAVSFAREKIIGQRKSTHFAIPMVSFCDLRLSELKEHLSKYGCYGIGLTKEWANAKGLNPVFYVSKHSPFTRNFMAAVERLYKYMILHIYDDDSELVNEAYMDILNAYRYIKNYEGELKRADGTIKRNYRFADEREWRYVPPFSEPELFSIPIKSIATGAQKAAWNKKISHLRLHFEPEDIQYLITKTDNERLDLIRHLELAKERFHPDTVQRLASRILTAKQIKNDM